MYIYLIVIRRVIGFKQLIFDEKKNRRHKQKAFQTDDMGIKYECSKRYNLTFRLL